MEIKHPLSVIDGRKIPIKDAFSWILHYFNPNKRTPELMSYIIDCTCGQMLMWHNKDLGIFNITTNDINSNVKADFHYNVTKLDEHIQNNVFDIAIYDPPYINLKNRKDSKKYEKAFQYDLMKDIKQLEQVTCDSSLSISNLLNKHGILIAKITDFHLCI